MDRRNFIRVVTSVYASNTVLATLTTSAMGGRLVLRDDEATLESGDEGEMRSGTATAGSEKVTVSNKGKNLVLDVSGKPGRVIVVLYKLKDKTGNERTFVHSTNRIGKTGVASMGIDMAQSLDLDVPFMVVTSDTQKFTDNNSGTDWFIIRINSTKPISSNLPHSYAMDPSGVHQKVVRYGISQIQKRPLAPLKQP